MNSAVRINPDGIRTSLGSGAAKMCSMVVALAVAMARAAIITIITAAAVEPEASITIIIRIFTVEVAKDAGQEAITVVKSRAAGAVV